MLFQHPEVPGDVVTVRVYIPEVHSSSYLSSHYTIATIEVVTVHMHRATFALRAATTLSWTTKKHKLLELPQQLTLP